MQIQLHENAGGRNRAPGAHSPVGPEPVAAGPDGATAKRLAGAHALEGPRPLAKVKDKVLVAATGGQDKNGLRVGNGAGAVLPRQDPSHDQARHNRLLKGASSKARLAADASRRAQATPQRVRKAVSRHLGGMIKFRISCAAP